MHTARPALYIPLFCVVLVGLGYAGCKKKGKPSTVPAAFEGCLAEFASIQEFAKTGLEGASPADFLPLLAERLDRIGGACSPLFVHSDCKRAVAGMKEALGGGAPWIETCRKAYCESADDDAVCQGPAAGPKVLGAIWRRYWGAEAGAEMQRRFEALKFDGDTLNSQLTEQAETILSAPIGIDATKLVRPTALSEELTGAITLTVGKDGMQLAGEDMETIPVSDLEGLPAALAKVASAIKTPRTTSVSLVADETLNYQGVIDVMDQLIAAGFENITLGSKSAEEASEEPGDTSAPEDPTKVAVVTLSKTQISVDGTLIGELDKGAESWQAEMVESLKAKHPDSTTLVIQADRDVLYTTIISVIDGAKPAGYVDILFAVNRAK